MDSTVRNQVFLLRWLVATTLGFSGGIAIASGLPGMSADLEQGLIVSGLLGAMTQAWVLKDYIAKSYWWIPFTMVGFLLGSGLSVVALFGSMFLGIGIIGMASPGIAIPGIFGMAIAVALFGTGVGLVQWLLLGLHCSKSGGWVLVNTISWAVGGGAAVLVTSILGILPDESNTASAIAFVAVATSVVGMMTGNSLGTILSSRPPVPHE